MSDEIFFDGHRYISASEASSASGLSRDYISRLCRDSKLRCRRIGKNWYVHEDSLQQFLIAQEYAKGVRKASLAEMRALEYRKRFAAASLGGAPEVITSFKPQQISVEVHAPVTADRSRSLAGHVNHVHKELRKHAYAQGERAARLAPAVLANPLGVHDAMLRGASHGIVHVPTYALSPFAEFIHKFVALAIAFTMTFGTYALVDPEYARFALTSIRTSVASVSESYASVTSGDLSALVREAESSLHMAVENPSAVLAQASATTLSFIPNSFANLARSVYTNVNSFIYAIAFPDTLTNSYAMQPGGNGSVVVVEVAPYARTSALIADISSPSSQGSTPASVITERIVERVETERIVSTAGGISEEYLNARLNDLETTVTGRLMGASSGGGNTTINNNYQLIAASSKIDQLSGVAMSNSTFTNGTIRGSALGDIASLEVAGDTTLSSLTVRGDTTLEGTLNIPGALSISSSTISLLTSTFATTSFISAVNASTTNLTWMHATGTNTVMTNATSTNFFANFLTASSLTTYAGVSAPYFNATSTTATSTFAGGLVASRVPTLAHTFGAWTIGAANSNAFDAALVVNPASAAADSNLISASVDGSVKFLVDAEGDVFVNNLTSVGSVTLSTTTASTFVVEGNTTLGDAPTDVTTINGLLSITNGASSSMLSVFKNAWFGGTATSTFDSAGNLSIAGTLGVTGNTTLTNATTTNLFSTTASSSNLFATTASFGTLAASMIQFTTLNVSGLSTFAGGFLSLASSTIGDGTQAGGLTILGGATTTGDFRIAKASAPTNGSIFFGTGTPNFTYNGSDFMFTGGNVYTAADSIVAQANSSVFGFGVRNQAAAGTYWFGATNSASPDAVFSNNAGAERIRITDSGNFGIGTTSPTNRLEVAGNTFLGGNLTATGTLSVAGSTIFSSGFLSLASTTIGDGTQAGGLTISGGATTTGNALVSGNLTAGNLNVTSSAIPTNGLYLQSSNVLGFSANNALRYLMSTTDFVGTLAGAGSLRNIGASATVPTFVPTKADLTTGIGASAAGALSFITSGTTKLEITNGGNVGIGTTTPLAKLDIFGDAILSGANRYLNFAAVSGTNGYGFRDNAGTIQFKHVNGSWSDVGSGGSSITGAEGQFPYFSATDTLTATSSIFLAASGKVGIGTTTPWGNFSITGVVGQTNPLFNIASSTGASLLTVAGDTGFLGIGTTSPLATLDIDSIQSGSGDAYGTRLNMTYSGTGFNLYGSRRDIAISSIGNSSNIYGDRLTVTNNAASTGAFMTGMYVFTEPTAENTSSSWAVDARSDSAYSGNVTGGRFTAVSTFTGSSGNATGISAGASIRSSTGSAIGGAFSAGGTGGTPPTVTALTASVSASGGAAIANAYGVRVMAPTAMFASIGNFYGLHIATPTVGTSTNYALYSEGGTNYFGGNIGIGTTTPWGKLSVTGGGTGTGINFLLANSSNVPVFTVLDNGSITATGAITSAATSANTFPYASSTALSVSGTGYFGTASTANLSVSALTSGRVPFVTTGGAFTDASSFAFNSSASRLTVTNASTTALTVSGTGYFANASTTNLTVSGLTASRFVTTGAGGALGTSATLANLIASISDVSGSTGTTNLVLSASPTFTGTAIFASLRAAASSTIGGGTQATGLTISGGATTTGNMKIMGSVDTDVQFLGQASDTVSAPSFSWTGDLTTGMWRPAASTIAFTNGGTERMRITSAGNVGIGTTTPGNKLSVLDALDVHATAGGALRLISSSGVNYIQSALNFTGSSAAPLVFGSMFAGNEWMRITSTGNVGIGTTTPFTKLEVNDEIISGTYKASGGNLRMIGGGYGVIHRNDGSNYYTLLTASGDQYGTWNSLRPLAIANATGNVNLGNSALSVIHGGNVGVGTTTPFRKLSVANAVAAAQLAVSYDTTRNTEFQTDSSGDLVIAPSGKDVRLNDDNLWVCAGGACPTGSPVGTGNLIVETRLGVGTSSPMWPLTGTNSAGPQLALTDGTATSNAWTFRNVTNTLYIATSTATATSTVPAMTITPNGFVGFGTTTPTNQVSVQGLLRVGANSNAPVTLGTATSTFNGDIRITGKLDVGTIDPVYTVGGVKYATYGHSTVGIKEETMQTIRLEKKTDGRYTYTLDFDSVEKGSDFWLFYQITDFGKDWSALVVSLTPSFDGVVYYEKNIVENTLTFIGDRAGEVSLRLVGNRYDFSKWPNMRPDQDDDFTHHALPLKPVGGIAQ